MSVSKNGTPPTVSAPSRRQEILQRREQRPPIDFDPERIPESLIQHDRWILWNWDWNGKKWNKIPLRLDGRRNASSTDKSTWSTFGDAVAAAQGTGMGIGFVFNGDGNVGVDFDDCRDPTAGTVAEWAADLIANLDTYTEISPSGTGFKCFVRGKLPDGCRKQYQQAERGELEVYERGRFFTVTGLRAQGTPDEVNDRQEELTAIIESMQASKESRGNLMAHNVNEKAEHQSPTDDGDTALAAISVLDPNAHYAEWLAIGMALHSVDSSAAMCAEFDRFSRGSDKYVEGEPARKWASFSTGGKSVGIGSLCKMADDTGRDWRPKRQSYGPTTTGNHPSARTNSKGSAEFVHRQNPTIPRGKSTSVGVGAQERLEFKPFPVRMLPPSLRAFVVEGSRSIGCDPAGVAIPALVACAAAIGNSRVVRIKKDWFEPSILWAALVAVSGDRKSPGLALAHSALHERQRRALRSYERAHELWLNTTLAEYESDLAAWKKDKHPGKGQPPQKPEEPVAWRIMVNDTTIEALAGLLQKQPRGLLLACDELSAWFGSHQRYKAAGAGSDCAKWLEIHGGRQIIIDRKGGDKKTLLIPRASVSVCGTIQPRILNAVLTPEHRANGMAARLFLAMPPQRPRQWSEDEISEGTLNGFTILFDRLLDLEMEDPADEDDDPKPSIVHLSPEAKELFIAFVNEHGREQADLSGDMAACWSKLEGGAARLALVHFLIKVASGIVPPFKAHHIDADSMQAGITLARWFGHEAKRVEATFTETDEEKEHRELIEWIRRRGCCVTARDVQKNICRYSKSSEDADKALQNLVNDGLGSWRTESTGGRPLVSFILNSPEVTDTDTSRSSAGTTALLSVAEPLTSLSAGIGERYLTDAEIKQLDF